MRTEASYTLGDLVMRLIPQSLMLILVFMIHSALIYSYYDFACEEKPDGSVVPTDVHHPKMESYSALRFVASIFSERSVPWHANKEWEMPELP
jgi:hypothetical protein